MELDSEVDCFFVVVSSFWSFIDRRNSGQGLDKKVDILPAR